MSKLQDGLAIIRSLRMIAESGIELQQTNLKIVWDNSSLKILARDLLKFEKKFSEKNVNEKNLVKNVEEIFSKASTVMQSVQIYNYKTYVEPILKDDQIKEVSKAKKPIEKFSSNSKIAEDSYEIKLTSADRELLRKLDMEHEKMKDNFAVDTTNTELENSKNATVFEIDPIKTKPKYVPNPKSLTLSSESKQRSVPSSRIGRMVSFGTLAAGLGVGTVAEYARRTLGFSSSNDNQMAFMTEANLNRIVDTLCKVRGAALKLGQILSIQDDSVIHPGLAKALERVRKSADFMPDWQVDRVLSKELGAEWQTKMNEFQRRPFAAASIGQVHLAKTKDGQPVAIKIQYPGVAESINSDIDNLTGIMNLWEIFPKGMFLENLMTVAKRELAWEVDYKREAECTKKFKELLAPYPEYYVPSVVDELSTQQIFTSELLNGIPVDQCFDLDIEDKHFIGYNIIRLCLLEILQFRYMQTDPNWANFLYNPERKQIMLLDFGASRQYSKKFMDKYVRILKAAYDCDRETIKNISGEIGFFTGYESKAMVEAHVNAVMILGEIFQCDEPYDFANQNMAERIQHLVPTMLSHRLCPPPEEIYSLHRKLSGVFLLCAKLKVPLTCRKLFLDLYNEYIEKN